MKKVAGTLKLDQAQYRELEAFSKFGSDLDAATKAVLDKGSRNTEILKQGQFSPLRVEQQIAIIYLGTKNLLRQVPVNKVRDFEQAFLDRMERQFKSTLDELKTGQYTDAITTVLEQCAKDLIGSYAA